MITVNLSDLTSDLYWFSLSRRRRFCFIFHPDNETRYELDGEHRRRMVYHEEKYAAYSDQLIFKALSEGKSVGLSTGGIAELFESSTDTEVIIIKNRKGLSLTTCSSDCQDLYVWLLLLAPLSCLAISLETLTLLNASPENGKYSQLLTYLFSDCRNSLVESRPLLLFFGVVGVCQLSRFRITFRRITYRISDADSRCYG